MQTLPSEIVWLIVTNIDDVRDKCQFAATCRRFYVTMRSNSFCWSPLNLSSYRDRITSRVFLSILRNCAIPVVRPREFEKANNRFVALDTITDDTASVETTTAERAVSASTTTLAHIDLSGCGSLSSDAIHIMACSLPRLTQLHLNKYGALSGEAPMEQRGHFLYQTQPPHNLASSTLDLSKEPGEGLSIPESLLKKVLVRCPYLEVLSLQYQSIGRDVCSVMSQLRNLRHLDISSCAVSQASLQTLLRSVGRRLVTLKMLNIDLSNLTLLNLREHATNLKCFHLSCQEPHMLRSIAQVIERMEQLEDFRLTRLRTGSLDSLVMCLKPHLRRLDLAPKMNFHPNSPRLWRRSVQAYDPQSSERRRGLHINISGQQQQLGNNGTTTRPLLSSRTGQLGWVRGTNGDHMSQRPTTTWPSRTEHKLELTDVGLSFLTNFKQLVELRLCNPTISSDAFTKCLEYVPKLEILELRICPETSKVPRPACERQRDWSARGAPTSADDKNKPDFLEGIRPTTLPKLKELHLYHVWVNHSAADALSGFTNLNALTLYNCGSIFMKHTDLLRKWLLRLRNLHKVRIGDMPWRWYIVDDIVTWQGGSIAEMVVPTQVGPHMFTQQKVKSMAVLEGEFTFSRKVDQWRLSARQ